MNPSTIPRRPSSSGPVRLSPAQERMWISNELAAGLPTFTTPVAMRFHGRLSARALARALDDIVARHEILRTAVRAPEGVPLQFVTGRLRLDLPLTDLTHLPADGRHPAVMDLLARQARVPLDPAVGVIRAHLYRLADDDHVLYVAVHHIAWDGWSAGVFFAELSHLYGCHLHGTPPELPELPIQYGDFALWQRNTAVGAPEDLDYWLTELSGGVPALDLPTDRPRSLLRSTRAGALEHLVPAGLTSRLTAFARGERVTLAILVATGMHAVLHRCTGQREVASMFPSANRTVSEVENLIGFFVSGLMLRTECPPDTTFRGLLRQVRTKTMYALRHEDFPYDTLVEKLGVDRDPTRTSLGQIALGFQVAADGSVLTLPGLTAEFIELHNGTSQDELGLVAWETGGRLALAAEYRLELFEPKTVERLLRRIETVLAAGASDPERNVADLPLLTEDERVLLTRIPYGGPPRPLTTLHELVERQAALTPGAQAVRHEGETLDYRELNERANRLARHLRGRGVRRHSAVAVYMGRSADAAVTILAILKLGAYYVPIDPALPPARTEFMLADTGPSAVVTDGRGPAGREVPVIVLDEDRHLVDAEPGHDLGLDVDPDDIAYVMYTSGSTGQPKGVVLAHRGAVNLVQHVQETFSLTPDDRVLHGVPLTFDTSITELFWPLAYGASVEIAPGHTTADPAAFAELLAERAVTVTFLVPSVLSAFLAAAPPAKPSWRLMICNGEALDPSLLQRFRDYMPEARVVNGYGPTEITIGATLWELPADMDVPPVVPIGHTVSAMDGHVLDGFDHAPIGGRGELYLGGVGVAHGYLNRPRLTAERFVPDPFSGRPGARLYRTGDIVRTDEDGVLEFVGRVDDQLKVNGVRIEPGEIQAVLERDPEIREAKVIARTGLVAYVVAEDGHRPDARRLRSLVADAVPRYMVPSRFVVLDELPLTSSGKLDVRRLPDPGAEDEVGAVEFEPPASATERLVAEAVTELLGTARVGRHDDFFELGGNSLQGAQLVFEIGRASGVRLRLRDLFEAPSVAAIATIVDERGPDDDSEATEPDPPVHLGHGPGPAVYLVHAAAGGTFCYAELARRLANSASVLAFQAAGVDTDEQPLDTVAGLAARYVTALRGHRPHVLGGWSMGGLVAFEMARMLHERGEPVGRVVLIDTAFPNGQLVDVPEDVLLAGFHENVTAWDRGGQPASGDVLRRRLAVYRANVGAASRHHVAGKPYPGDVTVLRAAASPSSTDRWREWVSGRIEEVVLPGDHHSLLRLPHLDLLAVHLAALVDPALDEVQ